MAKMTIKEKIHSDYIVGYEQYNNTHVVKVKCSGQIRVIPFDNYMQALDFKRRMATYGKLKSSLKASV